MSLRDNVPVWGLLISLGALVLAAGAAFSAGVSQAATVRAELNATQNRVLQLETRIERMDSRLERIGEDVAAIRAKVSTEYGRK